MRQQYSRNVTSPNADRFQSSKKYWSTEIENIKNINPQIKMLCLTLSVVGSNIQDPEWQSVLHLTNQNKELTMVVRAVPVSTHLAGN